MNKLERNMVDVLSDLRENHHVMGIKAEFEAEGTRLEEALRLKEVCMKADLGLTIKIGGCEALRDIYECRVIGVERIVAPMIESPFALKKFLNAAKLALPADERGDIALAVNIETINAIRCFPEMLSLSCIEELDGIVLGRVDLTGSMGISRDEINSREIFEIARNLLIQANQHGLDCVIGGGVSAQSLPFFRELPDGVLNRYETRKVVFKCPEALCPDAEAGIFKAVGFELLWLKNKQNYYTSISTEDAQRIMMLESRYKRNIEMAGGIVG